MDLGPKHGTRALTVEDPIRDALPDTSVGIEVSNSASMNTSPSIGIPDLTLLDSSLALMEPSGPGLGL